MDGYPPHSNPYALPPAIGHPDQQQGFYPPGVTTSSTATGMDDPTSAAFASSAALGLAAMSQSGSGSGAGGGGSHEGSASVEPTEKGNVKGGEGESGEKKKQTRGARACTVCRKLKMRCVGAEEGPPCKRCKNGGHECIFEESQRGRRSNRKTDAMAKSLKSMEAKLESVLASISNPGLLAGSGGIVTDPSQRLPYAPLDSGPGGAEGRGDVLVGTSSTLDPTEVASALERIRASSGGGSASSVPAPSSSSASSAARPALAPRRDSNSAIIRKDPIVLPPLQQPDVDVLRYELGGGVGSHADIGPSRSGGHPAHHPVVPPHGAHPHSQQHHVHFSTSPGQAPIPLGGYAPHPSHAPHPLSHSHTFPHPHPHPHPHMPHGMGGRSATGSSSKSSPMEWSGVKDPAAADGSPRLHSLPDNTLNPLGLLAEASLRNTRKRPTSDLRAELEVYDVTGDLHHASDDEDAAGGRKGKGAKKGRGRAGKGKGREGDKADGVDGEGDGGEGEGAEGGEDGDGPAAKRRKIDGSNANGAGTGSGGKGAGAGKGVGKGPDQTGGKKLGMANRNYFAPGPMNILPLRRIVIEQRMPPALLEEKILTVEEVVELFELFFEHCARHCPFLDPEIHTPAATGSRSPFLFTCICTVAARYYTKRTDDLYRKCLRVAKRVAFDVMTKGYKSTEICQGFLLLCNWNQPAERFEEERTYQFSGIAIRMATDLNLHRKTIAQLPPDIGDETRVLYERELLNRERTWLYSFICDRSVSTQMGKPYSISREDYLIRSASGWHRQPGAQPSDSGLSAMVEMHRVVGRMIDVLYSDTRSVSGLNAHLDYPMLIRAFLQQLDQWRRDWSDPSTLVGDPSEGDLKARAIMRDFYHAYYRLFLLSFAVQHALEDPSSAIDLPSYCVLCFESAERMIVILRDFLGPEGILRYAIDSTFVYASYAATFLLKLVSPVFASFIDEEAAMKLVKETAEVLETAAVDEQHTPALYASFLRMLIENKLNGPRTAANSRAPTRPGSPIPGGSGSGPSSSSGMNGLALSSSGAYNGAFTPSATGVAYINGVGANGASVAAGLDAFLRSRAPSVGPDGLNSSSSGLPQPGMGGYGTPGGGVGGFGFDPTLGGAFPGGLGDASLGGFGVGGELNAGGDGGPAFDSYMVDDVLSANGFWSSMLMPGFGGPLAGLSGGSGTVFSGNPADPFSTTPFHSRPPSPSQYAADDGAEASDVPNLALGATPGAGAGEASTTEGETGAAVDGAAEGAEAAPVGGEEQPVASSEAVQKEDAMQEDSAADAVPKTEA
ncbi:hypothetical protein JCM6882_008404 [Rhodosporidiobolus microsporus]